MNKNKKPKLKIKNKKRFFIVSGIILTILIATAFAVKFYYDINRPEEVFKDTIEKNDDEFTEEDAYAQFDGNKINILFYGLDKNEYRDTVGGYELYRADTIMVATIDLKSKSIDILSVPRDTYVDIYDVYGKDKINASFAHGQQQAADYDGDEIQAGTDYLKRTVSELLGGIPIHFYIGITDMAVVNEIVDEIGGVEIDVKEDMYDQTRGGVLFAEKGLQTLNGYQYLAYIRDRGTESTKDKDRVARTQESFEIVFNQLKEQNIITMIPQLIDNYNKNIDSNLTLKEMTTLGIYAQKIDLGAMDKYVVDGDYEYRDNNIYYIPDEDARLDLVKEVFGIDFEPER
ncbi:MAG TPA: hypothetical protein DCG38_00230 [Eubacteriaceae bacterium]|nr:hypothetical protein [Eubacteriaceae bacterium]